MRVFEGAAASDPEMERKLTEVVEGLDVVLEQVRRRRRRRREQEEVKGWKEGR